MRTTILTCALALAGTLTAQAQHVIDVKTDKPGAPIQSTMYGLFFEDINYAADGGLYAELVKNRSFEFPDHLMGWEAFGTFEVKNDGPFERCPHYVELRWPQGAPLGTVEQRFLRHRTEEGRGLPLQRVGQGTAGQRQDHRTVHRPRRHGRAPAVRGDKD